MIFWVGITALNTYNDTIYGIIILLYSINYFFSLLKELPTDKIQTLPVFWINSGVLLYFAGTSILNLSAKYLVDSLQSDLIFFWTFSIGLNFLRNIFFGVGFICDLKYAPLSRE
jgi:hypothetical protein